MRAFYGILVVVTMTACKANESVSTVSPPPPDPQPNLWIQLNISGDAQAAPDSFPTTYDGVPWRTIVAGASRVVAVPGVHTFALASPSAKVASWCTATGENEYRGLIQSDVPTTVTFSIDCPPLVGQGLVNLTINASGIFAPSRIGVTLVRTTGPSLSRSIVLTNSESTDVALPVGSYVVRLSSGVCDFIAHFAFGTPSVIVREGVVATLKLGLPCNTNIP